MKVVYIDSKMKKNMLKDNTTKCLPEDSFLETYQEQSISQN